MLYEFCLLTEVVGEYNRVAADAAACWLRAAEGVLVSAMPAALSKPLADGQGDHYGAAIQF